jgi:CRISPR system Cascade subunit CasD
MSFKNLFLALRLEGPLQSWGFDGQYNRRNTGLMPTKSGIAGICCAALGYPRGSDQERAFLVSFGATRMTSIAIPRASLQKELPVRRLQDYHTVQNTTTAKGDTKDCHITHRQYLMDAAFGIIFEGEAELLSKIAAKLLDPVWGLWLGRKSCIPSAPILTGLKDNWDDALRLLIGERPIESFTRQEDVEDFSEGRDYIADGVVSFAIDKRRFLPRRIQIRQAKKQA